MPSFVIKLLIGLALSAGVIGGSYFAWQRYIAEPYRAEGRAQEAERLQPIIKDYTDRLEADVKAFKEIEKAFTAINAHSERLKKLATQAQKVKSVRQGEEKTRVDNIDRIVPTGETECLRVFDVIDRALR